MCSATYAATDSQLLDENQQKQTQVRKLSGDVQQATAQYQAALDQVWGTIANNLNVETQNLQNAVNVLDTELDTIDAGVTGIGTATTKTSTLTTTNLLDVVKKSLETNGTAGLSYDMLSKSGALSAALTANAEAWGGAPAALSAAGLTKDNATFSGTEHIEPSLTEMLDVVKKYVASTDAFKTYAEKLKVLPGNYELVTTRGDYFFNVFQIKPYCKDPKATSLVFDWDPDNNPTELYNGFPKRFTIAALAANDYKNKSSSGTTAFDPSDYAATLNKDGTKRKADDKKITYNSFKNADGLRLAASGFFSANAFQNALGEITAAYAPITASNVVVVDLRKELHGFVEFAANATHPIPVNQFPDGTPIANGMPIVQASKDNSRAERWDKAKMQKEEAAWLAGLNSNPTTTMLYSYALLTPDQKTAMSWGGDNDAPWESKDNDEAGQRYYYQGDAKFKSEKDIVTDAGAQYIQIPVTDHDAPNPADIDELVKLYNGKHPDITANADNVFYIHCSAGKGRTSMAFIVYTILQKGDTLSLFDLIQQIKDLRDYDLLDLKVSKIDKKTHLITPVPANHKTRGFALRLDVIRKFYQYRNDAKNGYRVQSFEDWLKTNWTETITASARPDPDAINTAGGESHPGGDFARWLLQYAPELKP